MNQSNQNPVVKLSNRKWLDLFSVFYFILFCIILYIILCFFLFLHGSLAITLPCFLELLLSQCRGPFNCCVGKTSSCTDDKKQIRTRPSSYFSQTQPGFSILWVRLLILDIADLLQENLLLSSWIALCCIIHTWSAFTFFTIDFSSFVLGNFKYSK